MLNSVVNVSQGNPPDKTQENPTVKVPEMWESILGKIQDALKQGRRVIIRGIVVKDIKIEKSARTFLIIINDGELVLYPSQLVYSKVVIL